MSVTLRFGAFDVDLASGDVRMSGLPKGRLQEQPLKVLAALAERPGEVVTREELRQSLWPDDVHVDFDRGLNKAVQKLRAVFGDSIEAPRYIETIQRRGYRFVAPLERLATAPERPPSTPAPLGPEPAAARRRLSRFRSAALSLAALAAAILGLTIWRGGTGGATASDVVSMPATPATTLAILPFRDLDAGATAPPLGLALADTLITKLSSVARLVVRPTSSIARYTDPETDTLDAGRRLGVDHVLEGSLQRDGQHLRVSVRLLRVGDAQPVWAEVLETDAVDLFELQDELSEAVATKLLVELSRREGELLVKRHTGSLAAWEEYQRGRYFFEKRGRENLGRAVAAFERAIEIDPGFALAHAGIAHALSPLLSWGDVDNADGLQRLRTAAHRGLELDDTLAEVHTAVAQAQSFDWDFAGEERSYRKAIALNPNYSTAYLWYGILLNVVGRQEEGSTMWRRAWELDPTGLTANSSYGMALHHQGRTAEAVAQLERTLELAPDFRFALRNLGTIHHELGDAQRARAYFEQADEPVFAACAMAQSGAPAEARALLAELEASAPARYLSPYHRAVIHASLGEADQAFAHLELAYQERIWELVRMNVDWRLRPLRDDLRFADLARRVGL